MFRCDRRNEPLLPDERETLQELQNPLPAQENTHRNKDKTGIRGAIAAVPAPALCGL